MTEVKFNHGASKIISGSEDGTIIVWDWKIKGTPWLILRGHSDIILGLALDSNESSDYTL